MNVVVSSTEAGPAPTSSCHALIANGWLDADARWCTPKRSQTLLLPVPALSKVFRSKCPDVLQRASQAGQLPFDPADTDLARQARLTEFTRHARVVCVLQPLCIDVNYA